MEKNEIVVIEVRGGVVQEVRTSSTNMTIKIIDYDDLINENADLTEMEDFIDLHQAY